MNSQKWAMHRHASPIFYFINGMCQDVLGEKFSPLKCLPSRQDQFFLQVKHLDNCPISLLIGALL